MSTLIWDYKRLLDSIYLVKITTKGGQLRYNSVDLLGVVVTYGLAVTIHIHLQFNIVVTEPVDRVVIQNNLSAQYQSLIFLGRSREMSYALTETLHWKTLVYQVIGQLGTVPGVIEHSLDIQMVIPVEYLVLDVVVVSSRTVSQYQIPLL